ncbi:hypothetical protein JOQ06_019982, partial [Pogonophryne albipinna]
MSCRKRCKREIFKFAQYLYRLVTGTLNTASLSSSGFWFLLCQHQSSTDSLARS